MRDREVVQIRQVVNVRGETVIQYFIPQNTPNQEALKQQLLKLRAPHLNTPSARGGVGQKSALEQRLAQANLNQNGAAQYP